MKRKSVFCLLLLAVLLCSQTAALAQSVDPDSTFIPLYMQVLENGLRVIVKEIPSYPVATVNMWVDAGSKDDPEGMSGMAHFFEHLLFMGTPTRQAGQIFREVEALGGYANAGTSLDYATYYIVVPSEHVQLAMEIQADAIRNSVFDQEEIDRERMVIHEEIRLGKDIINDHLTDVALEKLFAGTIYARPIAGTMEELANINREEMLDFHARRYVPNNMVLVVTGNVVADEIFALAQELYGDMPAKALPAREYSPLPVLDSVVYWEQERPIQQSYVILAFPAPASNTRDGAALNMASVILANGRSSRLYRQLIEVERVVNYVTSFYWGFSDMGMFAIYAEMDPANRDRFVEIVRAELQRMQDEPVSDDDLRRARSMARSSVAFATESGADVAMFLGEAELYGNVLDAVNLSKTLEQTTAADIQRAAQLYLNPDAYVHCEIKPEGGNAQ
ncbi:MAG TPA: insulinase family protein [Firmicutes bacterium]|jgi:zinc protease|nr:pitrilysin family protein [Bacillota bacterium]HHT42256.1 insulinase family protein [Bacillota bacterium]